MDQELKSKLDAIERKVDACKREASNKGHTFIFVALLILLARGC
jgi:hypothetical protein